MKKEKTLTNFEVSNIQSYCALEKNNKYFWDFSEWFFSNSFNDANETN